jgi:pimeloyl-ACP methyl ester carboxylesterase
MKTVLVVPGFREDKNTGAGYRALLDAIEAQGYRTIFVPIAWRRTTIEDWVQQLETEYHKHDPKNTILAGFSFGSMTVFVAATKRQPAELWLFSLSPYFSEDLPVLKEAWKRKIGHRRVAAFNKLSFEQLSAQITCPTRIMLGSLEVEKYPHLANRVAKARQQIKDSRYYSAEGADHDITSKPYIAAVRRAIPRQLI